MALKGKKEEAAEKALSGETSGGSSALGEWTEPKSPTSVDENLLSIEQNCINISVFDMTVKSKEFAQAYYFKSEPKGEANAGGCTRSINLPWFGQSMHKYEISDIKIKDYWLYIMTKTAFEIFVFDLNRIAFFEADNAQKLFEEALV
jgi:hypothetical protein